MKIKKAFIQTNERGNNRSVLFKLCSFRDIRIIVMF